MINYPYWKILAWRFIRAGLSGGIATVLAVQVVLKPDLTNAKEYAMALTAGFVAGFITALAKAIRDAISGGDDNHPVNKLPL